MPVGGSEAKAVQPGKLSLRLEHSFVPMSVSHVAECPDLGPECEGPVAPIPYNHHVKQFVFESNLSASLGISEAFAIETRWGLRLVDVVPTYSELDGSPKSVPDDIHHHDETLVDVTDPWLVGRLSHKNGPLIGSLQLGLSLPLGRTEADPYELGSRGESHQHLQAGTGTVVPIVGFGVSVTAAPIAAAPVTFSIAGLGLFSAYENDKGFRAPSRLYASQRVSVSFLEGVLQPFVGVELGHETEEYWQGKAGLEGSNVRTDLYGSTGLAWRFMEPWAVDVTVRGRVAALTHAPTFDIPVILGFGFSTSFELWNKTPPATPSPAAIKERSDKGVTTFEKGE